MSDPFRPVQPETPRERLIEATIQEIERHGLSQLTVRGVAAAAEMNIAAVNYHFRSKQALVAAALESSIVHLLADTDEFLARLPEAPLQVLTELLGYYLEGALRYPRIGKAHLYEAFVTDDYSGPFPRLFGPALPRLRDALCVAVPGLEPEPAARRVVAALSALYFPAFFSGMVRGLAPLDTPAQRALYVSELARRCLEPPTADAPASGSAPPAARKRTAARSPATRHRRK